jgi:type I restriction enzyme S subunit
MSTSWPSAKLKDVLMPVWREELVDASKEYKLLGARWYAGGLFTKDVKSGHEIRANKLNRVHTGDFVYNRLFAWKGSFAVASKENNGGYVSNEFPCYQVATKYADSSFIFWYFNQESTWQRALGLSSGATPTSRNRLKEEAFLNMIVPLPPLEEQRRIVVRIEELTSQIHEARSLRRLAIEEADSLSYASLRNARHRLLNSPHPQFRLGTLTKVTSGGTPSRSNATYWDGNIPWIKTGELLDRDIARAEEHITQAGVENSSATLFPPGTVLIALYGQGQTRGRTGRLLISAATNQACCAVLPEPEKFEPRFIQYWLRSLYIELREESQGGAQPNWNSGTIKDLIVALPPLSEQRRIVAELDALQSEMNSLRRLQAETAAELDALLPSVLSKAFAGEL